MDMLRKKRSSSTSCIPSLAYSRDHSDDMKEECTRTFEGITLTVSYVGGEITLELLREEFSKFGNVVNASLSKDHPESRVNIGYVSYLNPLEAQRAVEGLNGKVLHNCMLYVGVPMPRQRKRSKTLIRGIQQMAFCADAMNCSSRKNSFGSHRSNLSTSWEPCPMSHCNNHKTSGESLVEFKRSVLSRTTSLNS